MWIPKRVFVTCVLTIRVKCNICIQYCQSRVGWSCQSKTLDLKSLSPSSFLPSRDDILAVSHNLKVLVARNLCRYTTCLSPLSKQVPAHISHVHSEDMAKKSEFFYLDVLMKNEAVHADMVDIMQHMQGYLDQDNSPPHKMVVTN